MGRDTQEQYAIWSGTLTLKVMRLTKRVKEEETVLCSTYQSKIRKDLSV